MLPQRMCGKITFKSLDMKQEIKIKGDKGSRLCRENHVA
jgi:hypothetical protein